jgi:hypothetical protein
MVIFPVVGIELVTPGLDEAGTFQWILWIPSHCAASLELKSGGPFTAIF